MQLFFCYGWVDVWLHHVAVVSYNCHIHTVFLSLSNATRWQALKKPLVSIETVLIAGWEHALNACDKNTVFFTKETCWVKFGYQPCLWPTLSAGRVGSNGGLLRVQSSVYERIEQLNDATWWTASVDSAWRGKNGEKSNRIIKRNEEEKLFSLPDDAPSSSKRIGKKRGHPQPSPVAKKKNVRK